MRSGFAGLALHAEGVAHRIAAFEEALGEGLVHHRHLGRADRVPRVEIAARQQRAFPSS